MYILVHQRNDERIKKDQANVRPFPFLSSLGRIIERVFIWCICAIYVFIIYFSCCLINCFLFSINKQKVLKSVTLLSHYFIKFLEIP